MRRKRVGANKAGGEAVAATGAFSPGSNTAVHWGEATGAVPAILGLAGTTWPACGFDATGAGIRGSERVMGTAASRLGAASVNAGAAPVGFGWALDASCFFCSGLSAWYASHWFFFSSVDNCLVLAKFNRA